MKLKKILILILVFAILLGGLLPAFVPGMEGSVYAAKWWDDMPEDVWVNPMGEDAFLEARFNSSDGSRSFLSDIQFSNSTDANGNAVILGTISSDVANEYHFGLDKINNDGFLHLFQVEEDSSGIRQVNQSLGFGIIIQTSTSTDDNFGQMGYIAKSIQENEDGSFTFQLDNPSGKEFDFEKSSYRISLQRTMSSISVDVNPETGDYKYHYNTEYFYTEEDDTEEDDTSLLRRVEEMFASMLNGIATAINILVGKALGRSVTIDDLVFDDYPDTKLSYFAKTRPSDDASDIIWGVRASGSTADDGKGGLHETINQWYRFFRSIAIIGYMIILVYMGIRIMLSSTGKGVAQYKSLFMYWVMGVIILFFYPYVMKYAIELNVAFVKMVKSSRDVIIGGVSIKSSAVRSIGADDADNAMELETFDDPPFDDSGTDYMTRISKSASTYKRISLSIAYLILTWQLITLIIHYYKRLMIVGFLIVIFPLVALSFAIDRIADGKSQAFSKWNKEFILNVFIQSFHAIVYIFVCGTVYAAYTKSYDYILVIVGSTFLFTGEEIIKKIFSQAPSESMKSLAATAGSAYAAAMMVKGVASKTAKPFVGKDSVINKVRNYKANVETSETKLRVFDRVANTFSEPNVGARLDHYQSMMRSVDNNAALSEDEKKQQKEHIQQVANAVATMNNPHSRSAKDLAEAQSILVNEAMHNPNNPLLDDCKLSRDELKSFARAGQVVAASVALGQLDPVQIKRDVKAELAMSFPAMDEETRDKYANMVLTNVAANGARLYSSTETEEEFREAMREIEEINNSFVFLDHKLTKEERERKEQIERDAYEELDEDASKREKNVAKYMAIYQNRGSGLYSAQELWESVKILRSAQHADGTARTEIMDEILSTADEDIDVVRHILGKKIQNSGITIAESASKPSKMAKMQDNGQKSLEEIVEDYQTEARDGYEAEEFAIHQMIAHMDDDDAMGDMYAEIYTARRKKNQEIRDTTRDIAQDILAMDGVDIMEGSIDTTTKYLGSQTREDVEREAREARLSGMLEMATGRSLNDMRKDYADRARAVIDSGNDTKFDRFINRGFSRIEQRFRNSMSHNISDSYAENMRNYNNYKRGDQ